MSMHFCAFKHKRQILLKSIAVMISFL
uniref:Uncharacterized protein n=1 Tax=Arundo donax TaxID=35708 RepID=A0A0A8ZQ16_ARUDO